MKRRHIILTVLIVVLIALLIIPTPKSAFDIMKEKAARQGDEHSYQWLSAWYKGQIPYKIINLDLLRIIL